MARSSTTWTTRPTNAGKPRGTNKATREIKDFFRSFFDSREYRDSLKTRILKGKAMPIEQLGYYYVYGKPKERVELHGAEEEALTGDDLIAALVVRLTRLATDRPLDSGAPQAQPAITEGPVLVVGSTSESVPMIPDKPVAPMVPKD
jgi:hypothetical protein